MTSSPTPSPTTPVSGLAWDARLWGALVLLCGALFLDGLDVSMVGVALPSIAQDLDLSTSSLQWIVSGYVLGYGGLLLLGGRAADLLGRRRVFLMAVGVFAVASLLGSFMSDPALLIATRFIKGVAAAFTAPAGLSIITTTFAEGPARNRALAIYTACGASGFSMGLVLGGLLTELGWRYTFLLPAPIAALILVLGLRLIPDHGTPARLPGQGYDLPGAAAITGAMLTLVFGVVEAPNAGWTSPRTLGTLALAAVLLAAFVAIEQRTAHPLVRLGILRSGSLRRANFGAMAVFGSYVGFQFIGTLYMQDLLGWSALQTALAFLPAGLIVAFGAPRVGALATRHGTPKVIATGFVAFAAGYALFLRIDLAPVYTVAILPSMLLLGIGFALCFPSLNIQATAGVADEEQGLASGLLNTSFQVGGALVLAIVSAVIAAQSGGSTNPQDVLSAYHPALAVVTGVALVGLALTASGLVTVRRVAARALRTQSAAG